MSVHRAAVKLSPRILDSLPGIMTWLVILVTIVGSILFPQTLFLCAALFGIYAGMRFFLAGIASIIGIHHIQQWEQCDWRTRYEQRHSDGSLDWEAVHHLVIIPNYNEPLTLLCKTLEALAQQFEAKTRMTVVLAMEEAEANCQQKAEYLKNLYGDRFAHFFYTIHPHGLPGEIRCKSSNLSWAARTAKRLLVDEAGYDLDNILVTTMDSDTRWHRDTFYALTCLFALHPTRHSVFWQAPIRYHGNIWHISPPMRLINAYATALELAYMATSGWMPMPMSSYSLSLRLLHQVGYWDTDVIADEWHMFIKAYFKCNGKIQVERVFLPFLADAPTGKTLWQAIKNRYLQTLRHYWGSKEIGYTLDSLLKHPTIYRPRALRLLFRVTHDTLLSGAGWVLISFGSQLPYLLHEQNAFAGIPGYLASVSLQVMLIIVGLMGVVCWYADVQVRPPRNLPTKGGERLLTGLSFLMLPLLIMIFITIPAIDAQTRLLAGASLNFRVTEKMS